MTISLPTVKREKIKSLILKFRKMRCCKIRDFAHFLGLLTSACPAVTYGWVYTKKFERCKYLALKDNLDFDRLMSLPRDLHADFLWWETNILCAVNKLRRNDFNLELFSDASRSGWGAVCGEQKVHSYTGQHQKSSTILTI